MGQYYKFANIDKKQICQKNWHNIKLMEHSYLGNYYCNDILSLLSKEWKGDRIIHVGDYALPEDSTTTQNFISNLYDELNVSKDNCIYNFVDSFDNIKCTPKKDIRYVYNLDKKEYVDLYKQPIQWCHGYGKFISTVKINSFALLIGCGNGLGGGDYYGQNRNLVGSWAGDRFVSSSKLLEEYKDYKLRNEMFSEEKGYQKFYDKEEVIKQEKQVLQSEIQNAKKYGIDISELKLDSFGLLDEEFKELEKVFNLNKDNKKEEDQCL